MLPVLGTPLSALTVESVAVGIDSMLDLLFVLAGALVMTAHPLKIRGRVHVTKDVYQKGILYSVTTTPTPSREDIDAIETVIGAQLSKLKEIGQAVHENPRQSILGNAAGCLTHYYFVENPA